eukprot:Opistho-1_new@2933
MLAFTAVEIISRTWSASTFPSASGTKSNERRPWARTFSSSTITRDTSASFDDTDFSTSMRRFRSISVSFLTLAVSCIVLWISSSVSLRASSSQFLTDTGTNFSFCSALSLCIISMCAVISACNSSISREYSLTFMSTSDCSAVRICPAPWSSAAAAAASAAVDAPLDELSAVFSGSVGAVTASDDGILEMTGGTIDSAEGLRSASRSFWSFSFSIFSCVSCPSSVRTRRRSILSMLRRTSSARRSVSRRRSVSMSGLCRASELTYMSYSTLMSCNSGANRGKSLMISAKYALYTPSRCRMRSRPVPWHPFRSSRMARSSATIRFVFAPLIGVFSYALSL